MHEKSMCEQLKVHVQTCKHLSCMLTSIYAWHNTCHTRWQLHHDPETKRSRNETHLCVEEGHVLAQHSLQVAPPESVGLSNAGVRPAELLQEPGNTSTWGHSTWQTGQVPWILHVPPIHTKKAHNNSPSMLASAEPHSS